MGKGTNNADGPAGASKVVPLGKNTQSSNAWLGISAAVERGSFGSREQMGNIGGTNKGEYVMGKSVAPVSKNMNSGSGQKNTSAADQFKEFSQHKGSLGSREQMGNLADSDNKGVGYVGKGKGSTKSSTQRTQIVDKVQPGTDVVSGTSDWEKNMARSMKGLGGKKSRSASHKGGSGQ